MTTTTAAPRLLEQLRTLPDDAFTRLQYLARQIGCFNRCAMCSQGAARDTWGLTRHGLTGLLTALAAVAAERKLGVASGRIHRPGVVFPYLDNDIGSYPHLDLYAALARDVLGVRLRVSTVGYSRHATHLTAMHQRLAAEHTGVFDGIRFSLTPYAVGYTGRSGTSREEYIADLAAALRTYRPLFDALGHGAATVACELRFAPLVGTGDLTNTVIDGHHVLSTGPHLLISRDRLDGELPQTVIERLDEHTQPVCSHPGTAYLHVTADTADASPATVRAALTGTFTAPHRARTVRLHRFVNAADPDFHPDGRFTALHLYPATDVRPNSGYTDATRPFLNTLLAHKHARGLGRRDEFPTATRADVTDVLDALTAEADELELIDGAASAHLREQIHPQVTAYAQALEAAGYPPSLFFSRAFTIDAGQIVNQGRARILFRGLTGTDGEPMTPREERGFGQASLSTVRGPIWRITPLPLSTGPRLPPAVAGTKNPPAAVPSLLVEELDPCHLPDGWIEHTDASQGRTFHSLPGLPAA